jgi:glycosyltransferase involved in cell wall biosynthesis
VSGVHQFVPALLPGDATGQHTLEVRNVVRGLGLESDIYAEALHPDLAGEGSHFTEYSRRRARGDVLLYQMAVASTIADFLYVQPEPLAIDYHNVTPARFFRQWEPDVASNQTWGRAQLARMADKCRLAIADSAFNELELVEHGYGPTAVVPILIDLASFERDVDERALEGLMRAKAGGGADLLFVGRLSPNKAQHDLVKALFAYRRLYDPKARLHLVGRSASARYRSALGAFVRELGLSGAVDVAEGVSQAELSAYYRAADVFVSCSEHEGFCVPLLESMHHGVPVVAYSAAAVPETLGEAGILLDSKEPARVAAALDKVLADPGFREALVEEGRRRLPEFSLERSRAKLEAALRSVLPAA